MTPPDRRELLGVLGRLVELASVPGEAGRAEETLSARLHAAELGYRKALARRRKGRTT